MNPPLSSGIRSEDCFADIYSEFTVPQTCGPAAMLYATIYVLEKEAGLIPEGSKPDPVQQVF